MKSVYLSALDQFNNSNRFIFGHALFASLVILLFVFICSRPMSIVPFHLGLITTLYTGLFCLSRLLVRFQPVFNAALFGLITTTLILVYIINFFSNLLWNDNVNLPFILLFVGDLHILMEGIPFGFSLVIAFVLGLYVLMTVFYLRIVQPARINGSILHIKLALILSAIIVYDLDRNFTTIDPAHWEGEPLSGLMVVNNTISHFTPPDQVVEFEIDPDFKPSMASRPNIVLVHADTLRADHVSSMGYERETTPFLESLRGRGATQVEMGVSICSESVCGVLAALGGRYFKEIDEKTPLLQTYLKKAGYRVVFSGSGKLSWEGLGATISHEVDHFFRSEFDDKFSINDDMVILDSLTRVPDYSDVPTFFFLHFMTPHNTGRHLSQYQKYSPAGVNLITALFPFMDDQEIAINTYDNYVYQLDDLVRKSIDILEQKGYMKNSLFVLYGDHGEGFREHGLNQHYNHLYQEMIHVPLIFHSSQGKLDIDKRFGTLEDILPTVLDMVDLPVPDEVGGVSLRDPPAQRITYHDSRKGIYAVMQVTQTEMFKLIREKNGDVFLYDITEDPGEKIDVKDRFPEKTTILLAKLKQRFEIE